MIESEYLEIKNMIQDFRNKLQSVQNKLDKRIIIFIDELDRCNPIYTIKTLEVIKHFFGIPNIIFVLSTDKAQIENSVRKIFGINEGQENGYLRKFIDVEFQLPKYNSKEFITIHLLKIWNKIEFFIKNNRYYNYKNKPTLPEETIYLVDLIFNITNLFKNFSLRDIEKFFTRLELTLDTLSEQDVLLIEPCILLNILLMHSIEECDNYINNIDTDFNNVINQAILPCWKGLLFDSFLCQIEKFNERGSAGANTVTSNAVSLSDFLDNTISKKLDEQEKYLKDYYLKIRYIHCFEPYN